MHLSQYGDYLYLYLLLLCFIPAIALGVLGKNIKYYGALASCFMLLIIIGRGISFILLLMFIVGEVVLIKLYLFVRGKTNNVFVFWMFLLASILPVFISKASVHTDYGLIGFMGLSYLNFKAIQIIIEIYDDTIQDIPLLKLIYFIIFFPTLSSGPIDRYRRFDENLKLSPSKNEYVSDYLVPGIKKIILAIGYKFVLAYLINTYWLIKIPSDITVLNSVNYMYAYSMFLFFDFAGYSLFAIGTSYIFGIKTPENFNMPFISRDMKEFWTRWHISLSRWFGDYVYSRFVLYAMRNKLFKKRSTASHVGQMITMTLMGLWHGLSLFYVIYGIYQGLALVLTDIYQKKSKIYKKHKKNKVFNVIQIVVTFHIACFGLLLFSGYLFK